MGRCDLELVAGVEEIGADVQIFAARGGFEPFPLELRRDHFRLWIPESDKRAMVLACGFHWKKRFQNGFLLQVVLAYALDAQLERHLEARERLEGRQHRRRGLEPRVASGSEAWRLRPLVGEHVLLGEPAGVERAQAVVPRMHIKPARAGAAAQV